MSTTSSPGLKASEKASESAIVPAVFDGSTPLPPQWRGGVLLLGNFDGLHRGHRALLALGRRVAGWRPLGVMGPEPHPRQVFDPKSEPMRIHPGPATRLVLGRAGVNFLYAPRFDAAFAALPAEQFVEEVLARALGVSDVVAGADFRFGARRGGDIALLARMGGRMGFNTHVAAEVSAAGRRISSSGIRAAIARGEIATARADLGGGWITPVRSEAGRFAFLPDQLLPPPGCYLVRALSTSGQVVTEAPITLREDRSATGALPASTGFFDWIQRL